MPRPANTRAALLRSAATCAALAAAVASAQPADVRVVTPERRSFEVFSNQPSTAEAFYEADLGAKVSGHVSELLVDVGARVKSGQVLARIAVPELVQVRNAAVAEVAALRSAYERTASLVERKSVTERALTEAGRLDTAVARQAEAEAAMQYATIQAPFDGIVTLRTIDPGDMVHQASSPKGGDQPLLRVAKLDVIRVKTYVPERDSVWADVGDRATITFDALPGRAFAGEIARLAGALDPQTRTMLVEIDLPNTDGRIRPGFYGQARLALEKRDGVVALPAAAIRSDGGAAFVYAVGANDTARRVNVTLGVASRAGSRSAADSRAPNARHGPGRRLAAVQPCAWWRRDGHRSAVSPRPERSCYRRAIAAAAWLLGAGLAAAQEPVPTAGADTLPIDLATALRLADERNLDVAIFVERIAEADAKLSQARTLAVPTIRIGGSYNRHTGNLQETSGQVVDADRAARFQGLGAGAVGAGDLQAAGLGVSVDLADAIFQPLVARQNRAAAEAAATANRHRVLVEVAAAYLRLAQARSDSETVRGVLERAEDLATLTADYAAAGEGLLADAEMAAVQPLLWEQRRLAADERTAVATAELAQLLHLDSSVTLVPIETGIPVLDIYSGTEAVETLVAHALAARPESEQLDALVAAAEEDFDAQRLGPFIPSVALSYSAGQFGGGPGTSIDNSADRDDLTVLLYWQLDNFGFGSRARTNEKRARLRQIGLERDKLHDAIVAEVRAGVARVASLRAQVGIAELTIDQAREAYTLHRDRIYDRQGLPLEALQAMQTLATAELARNDALSAYSLAQLRLHTALGNPPTPHPDKRCLPRAPCTRHNPRHATANIRRVEKRPNHAHAPFRAPVVLHSAHGDERCSLGR
jgi:RND family efflux transporter MFP subunit